MKKNVGFSGIILVGPRRNQNLIHVFGERSWKEIGPRRNQNLIHVFGERSWKEISEKNWTKKEKPRRNQNLIHVVKPPMSLFMVFVISFKIPGIWMRILFPNDH